MTKGVLSSKIDKSQEINDLSTRDYIGASSIGSDCYRQIWYECKGYEGGGIDPKLKRTFEIGKKLESLVLGWLEDAGIPLVRTWVPVVDSSLNYFKGHIDSMILKDGLSDAVLEIKTAKDSSFSQFESKGVKRWMPKYYAQVQSYMGMIGVNQAYIVVLNKDNSELLDERVEFDLEYYEGLRAKAQIIYEAVTIPPRVNGSPIWYQCKMCKFQKECHGL